MGVYFYMKVKQFENDNTWPAPEDMNSEYAKKMVADYLASSKPLDKDAVRSPMPYVDPAITDFHRHQSEIERRSKNNRALRKMVETDAEPDMDESVAGGTLGAGINQWNCNNPVSYEHVLDEVTQKWMEEQQLNELSVDKMRAYQDKVRSPETFKTRPFRKLAKGAEGNATATRKINNKIGQRKTQYPSQGTFEERLSEFVDIAEKDDFSDILNKQHIEQNPPKKAPTKEMPFHGWTIRYRPASKPGEKVIWQVMDKKSEVKGKGESMSDREAVADAEDYIKSGGGTKQQSTGNVTIDFNVNFTREFGDEFFANIIGDSSGPALMISYEPQQGLKRSYARNQKEKMTATTTKLTCIPMNASDANDAGLQPNGRYILGPKNEIGDGVALFPLIYQSTVQGKGDMMKMGKPGLTVAHSRDVSESEMDEAITPWGGYTKDDPKANAAAKAPKSSMQGSGNVRMSDMVKDTIETHGVKWAFEYYVKKHGMPPKHFQILAGLTAQPPAKKPATGQVINFPQKKAPAEKKGWWASMLDKLAAE